MIYLPDVMDEWPNVET